MKAMGDAAKRSSRQSEATAAAARGRGGVAGGDNEASNVRWRLTKTFEFILGKVERKQSDGKLQTEGILSIDPEQHSRPCVFGQDGPDDVAATPHQASPSLEPPTHRRHEQSRPEAKTHDPV